MKPFLRRWPDVGAAGHERQGWGTQWRGWVRRGRAALETTACAAFQDAATEKIRTHVEIMQIALSFRKPARPQARAPGTHIALHFSIETISQDQMMSELHTDGLHRVPGAVIMVTNILLIVVGHALTAHNNIFMNIYLDIRRLWVVGVRRRVVRAGDLTGPRRRRVVVAGNGARQRRWVLFMPAPLPRGTAGCG